MLSDYEASEAKRMGYDPNKLESFDPQTRKMVFKDGTERQGCAVITRVMGYHSETSMFNIGKKGEHATRKWFTESRAMANIRVPANGAVVPLVAAE